jgi:hypothetical protein
MEIEIRNSSDPGDVWATFREKEGYWIDEDNERAPEDIEQALENLKYRVQQDPLYKAAH